MNAVHKRDPLAVVSEVYQDFVDLLKTKRGPTEGFKNFESRFEAQRPFWASDAGLYDPAFKNDKFQSYLSKHSIEARPLPPRRHNKNVIESKHRVIRDIYIRLKAVKDPIDDVDAWLMIQEALRISNDLYGNDVISARELAKGYTRPIYSGMPPFEIPTEILNAHNTLLAKRKLTLI